MNDPIQPEFRIQHFRLVDCVGKITVSKNTSDEMIAALMNWSLNPHTFIAKS